MRRPELLVLLIPSASCVSSSQLRADRAEVFELRKEVKELQQTQEASRRELALVKAAQEAMKEKPRHVPAPAPAPPVAAPAKPAPGVTEDSRRSSLQHYLSGVVYYQKGDYEKAREEWNIASQLDPENEDPQAGLKRIRQLYGDQ